MRFDVAIVGDFRFPGGTSNAVAHEIRALASAGYSVTLVPVQAPVLRAKRGVHPDVAACIRKGLATLAQEDDGRVEAKLGVLHNPMAFTEPSGAPQRLRVGNAVLVAHQCSTDRNGLPYYDAPRVHEIAEDLAGSSISWAPISPVVREDLAERQPGLPVLDEDWRNVLFPGDWKTARSKPLKDIPVMGRHSRPSNDKWPATRSGILEVYPDDPSIEVRLLGVGQSIRKLMKTVPANWTAYEFNQIDPAAFLRTIDFFVYFHHPHLVEAFGRTAAEAIASGAVAILPAHFEKTFGEAALYAAPSEVVPLIRELHSDWRRYRKQSTLAHRWLAAQHGPERLVRQVAEMIGEPPGTVVRLSSIGETNATRDSPWRPDSPSGRRSADEDMSSYDVTILADMRSPADSTLRIAHEVEVASAAGFRVALLHMPSKGTTEPAIRAEIDACLRNGAAEVLSPSETARTRLLVVHAPGSAFNPLPDALPQLHAERVLIVADRAPAGTYSVLEKHRLLALAFRSEPQWVASSPAVREALTKEWPEIPLLNEDWTVSLPDFPWRPRPFAWDRPVVGLLELETGSRPSESKPLLDALADCYVRVLQTHPYSDDKPVGRMERFRVDEIAVCKFLDALDFLIVGETEASTSASIVAEAMARGVVVLAPPAIAQLLGRGAVASEGARLREIIKNLPRGPSIEAARDARSRSLSLHHVQRVENLVGRPYRPAAVRSSQKRRVAFISSNGVGLGHLTRLISVARRLPGPLEPMFITMSQAFGIAEDFGFITEYVPFHGHGEVPDVAGWNTWFRVHLEQLLDFYEVGGVVFDGGAPYGGLVRAIAPRPDLFTVWIRRGMWRSTQFNDPLIKRQKYFDLIVEPRDIAGARDEGLTAGHRGRVAQVDPIRLLDPEELLGRREAAAALGLDPDRPAVLIQLGAGSNRDIVSLTGDVIAICRRFPQLQIVVAEWAIGAVSFDAWPGIKVVRGFPLSRFFAAFDFTVSAVGYNSFNEIISFGLPAIFIANENPIMDDQAGRAGYAEEQGAAFAIPETNLEDLPSAVEALLDPGTARIFKVNCARIALPNGAGPAARLIAGLAGGAASKGTESPGTGQLLRAGAA